MECFLNMSVGICFAKLLERIMQRSMKERGELNCNGWMNASLLNKAPCAWTNNKKYIVLDGCMLQNKCLMPEKTTATIMTTNQQQQYNNYIVLDGYILLNKCTMRLKKIIKK